MRLRILMLPLLLAASTCVVEAASGSTLVKLRQYQHQEGRSLKDYINDGYEVKAILKSDRPADHEYFLQKGIDFVYCYEMSVGVGGSTASRDLSCSVLIQPEPYK